MPIRRDAGEDTKWLVSLMSGHDRKGRWLVARRVNVVNVMGGSDLDLNDAELAGDVVEMTVFSLMGGREHPRARGTQRRGLGHRLHGWQQRGDR